MKAEITLTVGGAERRLALPIGGLEQVAEKFPVLEELLVLLTRRVDGARYYRFEELKAVLNAGLHWGGEKIHAGAVIEELGLGPAADAAGRLLALALRADIPGNSPAAVETPKPTDGS